MRTVSPFIRKLPPRKPRASPGPARPSDRAPDRRGARELPPADRGPAAGRHAASPGPPRTRRALPNPGRGPSPGAARPREPRTPDPHRTADRGADAGEPTPYVVLPPIKIIVVSNSNTTDRLERGHAQRERSTIGAMTLERESSTSPHRRAHEDGDQPRPGPTQPRPSGDLPGDLPKSFRFSYARN